MKMPLKWHAECYNNSMQTLAQAEKELERLQERVERHSKETDNYYKQIMSAKEEGLDGFDRDRYKAKKPKKTKFVL